MDNTALHTFLFHCPVALRSLVLLGSWDNFSKPYRLELDARRGRNYWRGCFTFSDIICDGDLDEHVPKRNGPLKMGGTYWYYYKVDDDDECHNPSEPSTTFCPLLPGQRLNVLELPTEGHCRNNSAPSDGFTRNPSDRYLNPVPPKPLRLSPHSGKASQNSPLPLPSPWAPRSATYPPPEAFLSPNVMRHARSASASPHMPSTPLFTDFKCLKDKLASKRSGSRSRSSSKSQELEIGLPVLVSTTADDLDLIPLGSFGPAPTLGPAPTSAPRETTSAPATSTRPPPMSRNGFCPLGSHPVDPAHDAVFARSEPPAERKPSHSRGVSHIPSTVIKSEFKLDRGRTRANSADTRRTQHYLFSNDPWLSTPKLQQTFGIDSEDAVENVQSAPTLRRPSSLAPPSTDERPTSSHGSSRSPSLRNSPLDKELPALPRYLKPAPLFACSSPTEPLIEEAFPVSEDDDSDSVLGDLISDYEDKPGSHFSMWSNESSAYTSTSEDEGVSSPTFSSLTSDAGSPMRFSLRDSEDEFSAANGETHLPAAPPRLDDVRVSAFGSDLFGLDIQHADSAPRRQAACFGLGFQYSLPDDDTGSKTTITAAPEIRPESSVQRGSEVNRLMDDFSYLGDAVV
ncbi:hypothetical protein HBH98_074970 [Parastagonospora nodorum]|nr:hypothetical protein HBH53_167100 [Parastagonospora nodorum]KAH4348988.1 hypothetical protein HBH98_074970 [Parastagonospora nodorum]KAH4381315.1 hypothetical protein HBH99_192620 [Parastagonospora nodorum]KAH4391911.1 hypothetical protein HBH97_042620 [Parastagonospora nodorum]KAH4611926.1 hypothetical protein HBH82_032930 [Parastagonospora nodorum]